MKNWILASRPRTLTAIFGPIMIGSAIAYKSGQFSPLVFIITLLAGIGIQVGTNFANDYFDFIKGADTPDRIGPTRAVAAGLIAPARMLRAVLITFGATIALSLYLTYVGGWPILVLALCSVILGFLYTAGPYPIAYQGLGEFFVILFFGIIATVGTTYLQTGVMIRNASIAGLGPGFLSTALLVVNNLRDADQDLHVGKKTLIVRFGKAFGKIELTACLLIPAFLPIYFVAAKAAHPVLLLSSLYASTSFPLIKNIFTTKSAEHYARYFPFIGKLIFGYSLLFALGWLV